MFFNVCIQFCHQEPGNYNYLLVLLYQKYKMSRNRVYFFRDRCCPGFGPMFILFPPPTFFKGQSFNLFLNSPLYDHCPHPAPPTPASWGTLLNHILHFSCLYKLTF